MLLIASFKKREYSKARVWKIEIPSPSQSLSPLPLQLVPNPRFYSVHGTSWAQRMAKSNDKEEPSTAPPPDRWYNLALGPSFKDHHPSSKYCTLRCKSLWFDRNPFPYEFSGFCLVSEKAVKQEKQKKKRRKLWFLMVSVYLDSELFDKGTWFE